MAQHYLPQTRTGAVVQRRHYEVDQMLDAGTGEQIGQALAFVIRNQSRLQARNAMREASARVFASTNFR